MQYSAPSLRAPKQQYASFGALDTAQRYLIGLTQCQETRLETDDITHDSYRVFMVHALDLPQSSLFLLDAACQRLNPDAGAHYDPDDGRIGFVFPAKKAYKHPPVQQLKLALEQYCQALSTAQHMSADGRNYVLDCHPDAANAHLTLDAQTLLHLLMVDYARQKNILTVTQGDGYEQYTIAWNKLPPHEQCSYTCYYSLPSDRHTFYTEEAFAPLLAKENERRLGCNEPLLEPEDRVHHIDMNAPMVQLLNSAITHSAQRRCMH